MNRVFGIDLGTTYSCIAYIDEYGKPVVLKNSEGMNTTPSVVMVERESSGDHIIVGEEAKRNVKIEPENVCQFIKRKMGKITKDGQPDDSVRIAEENYTAPEVSAWILTKLVQDANDELKQTGVIQEGEEIKDVVITCPAYFGMNERNATKTAGELANLNVLSIINEPTAAAISYGISGRTKQETILVYDLGGGTFDITVMKISDEKVTVVCTGGDDTLGGKDWDEDLMNYVTERFEEEYGIDLTDDPDVVSGLYIDVETWKKALTSREKVRISVKCQNKNFKEELTREKFEEITREHLNKTKNLLDLVLKAAEEKNVHKSDIDKVLLVGGSSRMPQVSEMLRKEYGFDPVLSDPDEAVAKGAAIYANTEKSWNDFVASEAERTGKTVNELKEDNLVTNELSKRFAIAGNEGGAPIQITNVLSRTYGIEIIDSDGKNRIYNMLMINHELPDTETDRFQTYYANQSGIDVVFYESRSSEKVMEIEGRKPLTTIEMKFTKSVPKNTGIQMTLALDNSGMLHIMAEEELYHSKLDTTYQLIGEMSEEEKENISRKIKSSRIE